MSTITLTTRDIYGTDTPQVPDGWEAGDLCRVVENSNRILLGTHGGPISEKQLVRGLVLLELRKKPALVKWELTLPEGQYPVCFAKTGEVRLPKHREHFLGDQYVHVATHDFSRYSYPTLTPVQATKVER